MFGRSFLRLALSPTILVALVFFILAMWLLIASAVQAIALPFDTSTHAVRVRPDSGGCGRASEYGWCNPQEGMISTVQNVADRTAFAPITTTAKTKFRKIPGAKISQDLMELNEKYREYVNRNGSDDGFKPANPAMIVNGNLVVIDAVANQISSGLKSDLERRGLRRAAARGRMVSGKIPIDSIPGMADLATLKFVRPAYAMTRAGLVDSQGDAAMQANTARTAFEVDGTGITVGTLSDSYDCLGGAASDVGSGDLPGGIVVLDDTACPGIDEGRAMMQIVHDVAPGARQSFHTAFNGQADFASGILELATVSGANVITDDVIYLAEPMFQDGIIAQSVDAAESMGVSYFSSAGNNNRDSYEGTFNPSGIVGTVFPGAVAHDFDVGPGVDIFQRITVPQGRGFTMSFQWDDPFFSVSGAPGADSDVDIFVFNDPPTTILAGSADSNVGGDPLEVLSFSNPVGSGESTFNILIERFSGPDPGLMKYVRFDRGSGIVTNEFDTASSTIYGHANAAGAGAVGAAFYADTPAFGTSPPLLESFSSAGPTAILFDTNGASISPVVRGKPEFVAPDGVNTTFFSPGVDIEPDGFPNFLGTSAAAPHAAAVAALLLQAVPDMLPTEVFETLKSSAIDMLPLTAPGCDFDSGCGLIQADAALQDLASTKVQFIPLHQGWNLMSFSVNNCYYDSATPPTVPLLTGAACSQVSSIDEVFSSIAGKYEVVRSFDATGAHTFDPLLPLFSDLSYVASGYGYWIKMTQPATLRIIGSRAAPTATLALHENWNLVGFWPSADCWFDTVFPPTVHLPPDVLSCTELMGIGDVFDSIDGLYETVRSFDETGAHTFDPALPLFSDMHYVAPGYGFWVKMTSPADLSYPVAP